MIGITMDMHRHSFITRFLTSCLLVSLSCASVLAADTTAVSGQRVFYTGHSFHMFVPGMIEAMVKTTDIKGHKLAGQQGIGGS